MSLDVVGPMQVMASANDELARQGRVPAYALRLLAEAPGPVACSAGFETLAQAAYADEPLAGLHTLLVPGGQGVAAQLGNAALLDWLRRAEPVVARLGSVCSGALLLAQAGLLDGRPATTHWERIAELSERHPQVRLQGERLHTYDPAGLQGDGHVFTSAGVSSGIDLALALLEHDLGRSLALAVARRLVIYLRRPAGRHSSAGWSRPMRSTRHASRRCWNGFQATWAKTCRWTRWPSARACRRARSRACSSASWAPRGPLRGTGARGSGLRPALARTGVGGDRGAAVRLPARRDAAARLPPPTGREPQAFAQRFGPEAADGSG